MPSGGKRKGAGRKARGKNKRTLAAEELREKLWAKGDTPMEVLATNMWSAQNEAAKMLKKLSAINLDGSAEKLEAAATLVKETKGLIMAARECAKDSAPYWHPKLANIEVDGSMTMTFEDALSALD